MYRSKVCVEEFWYFVPDIDIQVEESENDNPALQKANAANLPVYKQVKSYAIFFYRLTQTYVLVVKVSRRKFGGSGSNFVSAETLWCPLAILRGTEPDSARQCTNTRAF